MSDNKESAKKLFATEIFEYSEEKMRLSALDEKAAPSTCQLFVVREALFRDKDNGTVYRARVEGDCPLHLQYWAIREWCLVKVAKPEEVAVRVKKIVEKSHTTAIPMLLVGPDFYAAPWIRNIEKDLEPEPLSAEQAPDKPGSFQKRKAEYELCRYALFGGFHPSVA